MRQASHKHDSQTASALAAPLTHWRRSASFDIAAHHPHNTTLGETAAIYRWLQFAARAECVVYRSIRSESGALSGVVKIKKQLATGGVRYYCYAWRGGPLLKNSDGAPLQPDDPALAAAFKAAHQSRRSPAARDMSGLITKFKASSDFKTLSSRLRSDYSRYLDAIREQFGVLTLEELQAPSTRGTFKEWRDALASTPRAADYAWTTLARVLSFGKDRGLLTVNVAERGGRLYRSERSDKVWSAEKLRSIMAVASDDMRMAVTLALWTGQRQGDLLTAAWSDYDGKAIRFRQRKTAVAVSVPVGASLALVLDPLRRDSGTILTNSRGQPWSGDGFRSAWQALRLKAGVVGLTFHDLRGTAVTRMALAGCTAAEIASLTGHSMRDVHNILDAHYLGGRAELARSAMAKLEAAHAKECEFDRGVAPWP